MSALQNVDAERGVLGLILWDNRTLEQMPSLRGLHFATPAHAALFEEVRSRINAGRSVDPKALKDFVAPQQGGLTYVVDLMESAPLATFAGEYAARVVDAWRARQIAAVADEMRMRASRGDEPLSVLCDGEIALQAIDTGGMFDGSMAPGAGSAMVLLLDQPSLPTGLQSLDTRLGGLYRGDLIIAAARPSMGKTTLASQIARNIAGEGGVVHFASLEMSKEQLARRAVSGASFEADSALDRIEYFHIRHGTKVSRDRLQRLANGLPKTWWIDDRPAQTLATLEASARATRKRYGRIDLVIVDHLQIMRAPDAGNRLQELTQLTGGLKSLAKRLNVPVLALCQLNRSVEGRDNKRPTLADLRESGTIEQDADVVLSLYREAYYLERDAPQDASDEAYFTHKSKLEKVRRDMEIITLKQRQGPLGTDRFEAWLEFDTIRDRAPERPALRMVREE